MDIKNTTVEVLLSAGGATANSGGGPGPIKAPPGQNSAETPPGSDAPLKGLAVDLEEIARVAHEVNRAYCAALGDTSQLPWNDAPQWQRDSAVLGVKLHTGQPNASAAASHESWMAQKVADGWVFGPEKRPDLKQHPCIVPFDALPREQQAKDFIFRGVVHALAHRG